MSFTDFSLVAAEDKFITSSPDLSVPRPGLYPSEASVEYWLDGKRVVVGKCMRAAWYRSMNIQIPASYKPGLMMKAALGKWGEQYTIDRWKAMGIWVGNNIKFYNKDLFLSGELDAVVRNPLIEELILYEIKSYYGYLAVKEICGSKRPPVPGKPKESQFLQAVVYSWEYKDKIPETRLYYLERGDGHRVEFRVGTELQVNGSHTCYWEQLEGEYWSYYKPGKVLRPYSIEDIHARYKSLITHLKDKKLPPKDFQKVWDEETVEWMWTHDMLGKTKYEDWQKSPKKNLCGNWECSYCEYQSQCEQDELTNS